MKIHKISIVFLVFSIFQVQCRQYNIGAILDKNDPETEISFLSAIERANIHERELTFIPIVRYLISDDASAVEKIVCNLMTENVIAIFGPTTKRTAGVVSSICSHYHIPHFLFTWMNSGITEESEFESMTVNFYPESSILAQAFGVIVQENDWQTITVLYTEESEYLKMADIFQLNEQQVNSVKQLIGPDYRPLLKQLKMNGVSWYVIICPPEVIVDLFTQADEIKVFGEYQSVFLASLDAYNIDFSQFKNVKGNITTIRISDPTDFYVQNLVIEWEDREKRNGRYAKFQPEAARTIPLVINDAVWALVKSIQDLKESSGNDLVQPKVNCNRKKVWNHGQGIIDSVKSAITNGGTGKSHLNAQGERIFFTAFVLEYDDGIQGFEDVAIWDPVQGAIEKAGASEKSSQKAEQKMSNKTFIITSRIGPPFLFLREPPEGTTYEGNERYEGYSMDLIDAIAKQLGFKYVFKMARDGKYGGWDAEKKSWNGLIKELLDGEADLGICDLTMTSARRKAVDFTPPFMTLGISILYIIPEQKPQNLFSFMDPFTVEVWVYTLVSYALISVFLLGVARVASDEWENTHPCKEATELENIWTLMNTTWLGMGSIMGQGCDILPKALWFRLVTSMWWFFALMMINSYTANLAAFLTSSRMGSSIENVQDLAAQTKVKYGAVKGASTMNFFKGSNFSIYQKMWAAMESAQPSVFTENNEEGVRRVKNSRERYAFLMESTVLEYIIERDCKLFQVGGWLDYKTYGIAMPFNSPYRKQVSHAVLKLGEGGTLAALKRKWWKEMHINESCSSQAAGADSDTPELGLDNVGGVFLVLGIGLVSSLVIGFCDFLWNVRAVAVEERMSLKEAMRQETKFVCSFWITTKEVRTSVSRSTSSSSSSKSKSRSKSSKTTKNSSKKMEIKQPIYNDVESVKKDKVSLMSTDKSGKSSYKSTDKSSFKSTEKSSLKSQDKSAKSTSLKSAKSNSKSEKSDINGKGVQCNLDRKGRERR